MANNHIQQFGRSKEASLGGFRYGDVIPVQNALPTPEESEQRHYRELFEGFFAKLIRWKEFAKGNKEVSIFQSDRGFIAQLGGSWAMDDPPNKVLEFHYMLFEHPERDFFHAQYSARPGPAGKELLIDPENRKLDYALMRVIKRPGEDAVQRKQIQILSIHTSYADPNSTPDNMYKGVLYKLTHGKMEVTQSHLSSLMPEIYQVHLFNTLDSLITSTPPPNQHSGERTAKRLITKRLPVIRRGQ